MFKAITRGVSRNMASCELTYRSREEIDFEKAAYQLDQSKGFDCTQTSTSPVGATTVTVKLDYGVMPMSEVTEMRVSPAQELSLQHQSFAELFTELDCPASCAVGEGVQAVTV